MLRLRHSFMALPLLLAAQAQAGPCDAYYRFEGNLSDSGPEGYHGQMVAEGNTTATPQFVEGASGKALKLDGSAAMRAMLDLSPDLCAAQTVVAWLKAGIHPNQVVYGNNGGNFLMISAETLSIRTAGRNLSARNAVFANAPWMFVAAVWDNEARTHRLHWNARHVEASFEGHEPRSGDAAIWIGALNDRLHSNAKDLVVDELQFIGRALTIDEINAMRAAGPGGGAMVSQNSSSGGSAIGFASTASGAACNTHSECGGGSYCAVDGTCHPESHLPMASATGSGMTLAELQAQMAARNANTIGTVNGTTVPDLTPPEEGQTLAEMQEQMAARNADVVGGIEGNSLPLPEGGAGSDNVSTGGGSGGDPVPSMGGGGTAGTISGGGTMGGMGSMSVGEFLAQIEMAPTPSGATAECRSPTQRIGDLATGFRDAVVEIAHTIACGMAERPIASLGVAAGVEDPSVYATQEFESDVFNEVIEVCRTATPDIVYLPDAMLDFWNTQIANNNWSTIGPRKLVFGHPETGNIISPGDRTFISTSPWVDSGTPHLVIDEFSGRARMEVRVCAINPVSGHHRVLREFVINDTQDKRQDEKETFLYTLPTVGVDYVSVFLDGRSTPDRHFRYTLKVER